MNIPEQNIYAYKDIKYDQVRRIFLHITNTIRARTKSLTDQTGIQGGDWFTKGVEWIKIRTHALKEDASKDFAIVSLSFIISN